MPQQVLAEDLAAFQLGGRLRRAEDPQSGGIERVDNARRSGISGPTTVSRTSFCWANLIDRGKSVGEMSTFSASMAVPALPGATYTCSTRGLAANFHARACSPPPLPITKTFSLPATRFTASLPKAQFTKGLVMPGAMPTLRGHACERSVDPMPTRRGHGTPLPRLPGHRWRDSPSEDISRLVDRRTRQPFGRAVAASWVAARPACGLFRQ